MAALPLVLGLSVGAAIIASPAHEKSAVRAPGGLECADNSTVHGLGVHADYAADDKDLWAATPLEAITSFARIHMPRIRPASFRELAATDLQRAFVVRDAQGRVIASAIAFFRPINGWAVSDAWVCAAQSGPAYGPQEVSR